MLPAWRWWLESAIRFSVANLTLWNWRRTIYYLNTELLTSVFHSYQAHLTGICMLETHSVQHSVGKSCPFAEEKFFVVYQMTQFSLCNSFSVSRNYNPSADKCFPSTKANEVSVNLTEFKTCLLWRMWRRTTVGYISIYHFWLTSHVSHI